MPRDNPGFVLLSTILVSALAGIPVDAQPSGTPPPLGARVRVTSPDLGPRPAVGQFQRADSAVLVIRRTSDLAVLQMPWARVDRVELYRGRASGHGRRGAMRGAMIGGVGLAILAAAGSGEGEAIDPGASIALGAGTGAALGALIGNWVGSARAPEVWEPVPLRPR